MTEQNLALGDDFGSIKVQECNDLLLQSGPLVKDPQPAKGRGADPAITTTKCDELEQSLERLNICDANSPKSAVNQGCLPDRSSWSKEFCLEVMAHWKKTFPNHFEEHMCAELAQSLTSIMPASMQSVVSTTASPTTSEAWSNYKKEMIESIRAQVVEFLIEEMPPDICQEIKDTVLTRVLPYPIYKAVVEHLVEDPPPTIVDEVVEKISNPKLVPNFIYDLAVERLTENPSQYMKEVVRSNLILEPTDDIRHDVVTALCAQCYQNPPGLGQLILELDKPSDFCTYNKKVPRFLLHLGGVRVSEEHWIAWTNSVTVLNNPLIFYPLIEPIENKWELGYSFVLRKLQKTYGLRAEIDIQWIVEQMLHPFLSSKFFRNKVPIANCETDIAYCRNVGSPYFGLIIEMKAKEKHVDGTVDTCGGVAQWIIYFLKSLYGGCLNRTDQIPVFGIVTNGLYWRFIQYQNSHLQLSPKIQIAAGVGMSWDMLNTETRYGLQYLDHILRTLLDVHWP